MSARLKISEIFCSIQGEGRYLGMPSIFVRLSGCNLRCQWGETRCDTPYTSWDAQGETWTVSQVMAAVGELRNANPQTTHAVVTGGEPLLQPGVCQLTAALQQSGLAVTIETNGTIFRELQADFISLSPKLATSTPPDPRLGEMHDRLRWEPAVIQQWLARHDCQLKFVYYSEQDESEIIHALTQLPAIPPESIYLMPEGIDTAEIQQHAQACAACCIRHGWRYTPRAHIAIYGNTRGT